LVFLRNGDANATAKHERVEGGAELRRASDELTFANARMIVVFYP
jgi:hypothetical protein